MGDCAKCDKDHPRGSASCPGQREGTTLAGKYQIKRLIGQGTIGALYEAEKTGGGKVAVKVLLPHAMKEPAVMAAFKAEAEQVAALKQPGIIHVRDLGMDEAGNPWLETELISGTSISELLKKGPIEPERAAKLIAGALASLSAAHAKGLIHRDLKPENLFVTPDDKVLISDFGIAKAFADEGWGDLTRTSSFMGTPQYISPEQAGDAKGVDHRADIYAMGATLFTMLTGRAPVTGGPPMQIMVRVARGQVDRNPKAIRPEVPEWLDRVVAKSLAPLADRYQTADEMRRALDRTSAAVTATSGAQTTLDVPGDKNKPFPVMIVAGIGIALAIAAALYFAR